MIEYTFNTCTFLLQESLWWSTCGRRISAPSRLGRPRHDGSSTSIPCRGALCSWLTTIIGENIMNDRCAVVLFTLFYGAAFDRGRERYRRSDGWCCDPWLVLPPRRLAGAEVVQERTARCGDDRHHSAFLMLQHGNDCGHLCHFFSPYWRWVRLPAAIIVVDLWPSEINAELTWTCSASTLPAWPPAHSRLYIR